MEITESRYCKTGLGAGRPECQCKPKVKTERHLTGGPGLESEIDKGITLTVNEPGLLLPDSVNSKEALSKFLESSGYKRGSDEYFKFYKMYSDKFQFESHNPLNK